MGPDGSWRENRRSMQESHFLNYDQFLPKKASAPNLFHCVECKKPGILRGGGRGDKAQRGKGDMAPQRGEGDRARGEEGGHGPEG
jgi:hypothetical protein